MPCVVLDPSKKMTYFRKNWSSDLASDVLDAVQVRVRLLSCVHPIMISFTNTHAVPRTLPRTGKHPGDQGHSCLQGCYDYANDDRGHMTYWLSHGRLRVVVVFSHAIVGLSQR